MTDKNQEKKEPLGWASRVKNFFKLGEVGNYFFRSRDSSRPVNFNIRVMHGINRLAIVIFLLGILYLVIKHLFFRGY